MMKGNVKCLQYCTTCENNQPSDMRLSIDDWLEDILNDNVRSSIHKVNMWCSGDSARPLGDLFGQHRLKKSFDDEKMMCNPEKIVMCSIFYSRCKYSCRRWCRLIVVCARTLVKSLVKFGSLLKFCFGHDMVGVQSSARPPGRIGFGLNLRECRLSCQKYYSWYAIRQLIVVWSSRRLQQGKVIEAEGCFSEVGKYAKNLGKGLCSEVATDTRKNRKDFVSVTDNHPVGIRCLARMSVTELHFDNAGVRCEEAVGDRTRIWTDI